MRKLLLVMLVPILVLGVMGCGKETVMNDGNPVISAMQGFWDDGAGNTFVLSASQITVFKDVYATTPTEKGTVAFWINATGAISETKDLQSDETYQGTIEFYGYGDTKKQKIATIEVTFDPAGGTDGTIRVTKVTKEIAYENQLIPPVALYSR